jgi:Carboxymuconolactone decarboxylase family
MASRHECDAWVALPDEATTRAAFPPESPYDFGFVPAMGRLLLAHPTLGPTFGALFGLVMFGPGQLTRREREMIAAVTAVAQDCHY